ncbi:MAG: rRNA maturation RNase YbeY [Candidatus Moranbacteria bacterium]|nr:rRNA maturation RNase YbeY [Candidatus Moranbacteria bacterium]
MNKVQEQKKIILDMPQEGLCGFDYYFFHKIAEKTIELSRYNSPENRSISFSIESVSKKEIALLNERYMKKKGPTDILSFPTFSKEEMKKVFAFENIFLGEIILCQDIVREDSEKDGVSYDREMTFVFSHGILHLLGYEHGEEMFALQDKVCDNER